jgi:hypothetical protein
VALLRASGEASTGDVDALSMEQGANVASGPQLVRFATAALTDVDDLTDARAALLAAVGDAGVVEAAGTIAAFEGLNRIADATGIQLDDNLAADTADVRGDLGIDDFSTTDGKLRTATNAARATSVMDLFR